MNGVWQCWCHMEGFLERCTVKRLEFDAGLRNFFVLIYTFIETEPATVFKRKKKPRVLMSRPLQFTTGNLTYTIGELTQTTWWASHAQLTKQ